MRQKNAYYKLNDWGVVVKQREWLIKGQSADYGIIIKKKTKRILAQTIYFCLLFVLENVCQC